MGALRDEESSRTLGGLWTPWRTACASTGKRTSSFTTAPAELGDRRVSAVKLAQATPPDLPLWEIRPTSHRPFLGQGTGTPRLNGGGGLLSPSVELHVRLASGRRHLPI